MAETNGAMTPPLFREPLVQAGPWTMTDSWQRWLSAFWQQQAALWAQSQQPHVLGTGAAGKVGVWQDATTLGSDALLHWDGGTKRLGVGIAAPGHALHVVGDVGISSTLLVQGATTLNGATTINASLHVQGPIGQGTAPVSGYSFYGAYSGYLRDMTALGGAGIGVGALGTHTLVVGPGKTVFQSGALVGIGVEPRWALEVGAPAHIAQLGVYYGPPTAVWFRTSSAAFDSVQITRGDAAARWPLDCAGLGHINQLGVNYGADVAVTDGVYLRATTVKFDSLGVGYAPAAGISIRAGNSQFDALGLGYAGGLGYSLRCVNAWFDHIAVAEAPVGGWYITTPNLLTRANAQISTSLYVGGVSHFVGPIGVTYPPDASWSILCGNIWAAGLRTDNPSGFMGAMDGSFSARFYTQIYCDGIPYSAYPGPWNTWSDERLKRNIAPIAHALDTMTALRGVWYEYTDTDMGKPAGQRMGVIAQEVEAVLPTWVGELKGFKTTQLSAFEALTIESFKELTARVAALEGV